MSCQNCILYILVQKTKELAPWIFLNVTNSFKLNTIRKVKIWKHKCLSTDTVNKHRKNTAWSHQHVESKSPVQKQSRNADLKGLQIWKQGRVLVKGYRFYYLGNQWPNCTASMATHDELQVFTLPPHTVFPPYMNNKSSVWIWLNVSTMDTSTNVPFVPQTHTHKYIWKQASRKGEIKHCKVFKTRGGGEIHKYRAHNKEKNIKQ